MVKKICLCFLGLGFFGLIGIPTATFGQGRQFEVRQVPLSSGGATYLQMALNSLADNTGTTVTSSVINMSNHFPGRFPDNGFPDPTQVENFAVEIRANVVVGKNNLLWTFGVGSDDGFLLEIEGGMFLAFAETVGIGGDGPITGISGNRMFYPALRWYAESYGVFQFSRPGIYRVRLVYYNGPGTALLDFFAGRGNQLTDLPNAEFYLVNDSHPNALQLVPLVAREKR
ncbi:MAG: hypothetical protein ACM3TN_09445 [Alphaproteobacteria bacterium]